MYTPTISTTGTFYLILEDDSGQLLSDNGSINGSYDYHEDKYSKKLVIDLLDNCRIFTDKKEAERVSAKLEKACKNQFSYTILTINVNVASFLSLE